VWTARSGIALSHLDGAARDVELPLETGDRWAKIWIELRDLTIEAGTSLALPRVMLTRHHGDFFAPLAAYREALRQESGVSFASPPVSAYEPIWCSWGYEFDVRPEEILGVLPKLEALRIPWVVLDDRWFTAYGDWQPRPEIFGDRAQKLVPMVREIHRRGMKAKLWWIPFVAERSGARYSSHVYRTAEVLQRHADWLILDRQGKPAVGERDLSILCPALPAVKRHTIALTTRFIGEWGFDGHKIDRTFAIPPCFNPKHGHRDPYESSRAMADVLRAIFETTRRLKPNSVTEVCPCGGISHHAWLPYVNQVVTADPVGAAQMRRRVKLYKGLMGPRYAVYADHVELTKMVGKELQEIGEDFASIVGTGAIPGTKFVWPAPTRKLADGTLRLLTPQREAHWRRWLDVFREKNLARGEYLNLYDLAFDRPETHVVRQDGKLYYAVYAAKDDERYRGLLRFRGLPERGAFEVYDYVNKRSIGLLDPGKRARFVDFVGSLLLEVRARPGR
jgi:alpha-galactosidase